MAAPPLPQACSAFADAPTFQQAGYPDVVYILWTGVFAPKKTPEPVTRILRGAIRRVGEIGRLVLHVVHGPIDLFH